MAEIKVLATLGVQPAYEQLVPPFAREGGHDIAVEWVPTVLLMQRMRAGERPDLLIMASDSIETLVREGKLAADSRVDFARSGIAVAVKKGAAQPDVRSTDSLIRALKAARTVAYSTGPSGVYLAELIAKLGLTEILRPKLTISQGGPVGALVANGKVELAFQQMQELMAVDGLDVVGPLPAEIQKTTQFSAARPIGAKNEDAITALVDILRSPNAAPVYLRVGMQPV